MRDPFATRSLETPRPTEPRSVPPKKTTLQALLTALISSTTAAQALPTVDLPPDPGTHPTVAAAVAQEALDRNIRHIWFHRSYGDGSVSAQALELCRSRGVEPIEGGCPLMYCPPVDPAHRVFRWWLRLRHRVPG